MAMPLAPSIEARYGREHAVCLIRCGRHEVVQGCDVAAGQGFGLGVPIGVPNPPKDARIVRLRLCFQLGFGMAFQKGVDKIANRQRRPLAGFLTLDAQAPGERRRERIKNYAELTIALGPGPVAGAGCDLVIETFGPDVGAIIRSGAARAPSRSERDKSLEDSHPAAALETGIFTTGRMIGETVTANEPLGVIGVTEVVSPVAGRIRGLQRTGRAVVAGAVVADIASKMATQVSGSGKTDQLVARGVAFAIEMEFAGWTPVSFDGFR
jgi:hypothetical protein